VTELSEWLRQQMRQHALGTAELAQMADVTPNTVTAWRTGRRSPSEGSSRRLAAIFKTDPELVIRLASRSS
jgi:transcriptional regulator with XRE-family HTH domain